MMLPDEEYDPHRALRAARMRRPEAASEPFAFDIRDAEAADMPDCRGIYNHYVQNSAITFDERPLSHVQMRAQLHRIRREGNPWLVAVAPSGAILGYAHLRMYRDRAAYRRTVEDAIYLAPAATGKGVGRALLSELLRRGAAAGRREVIAVIADRGAEASIALHAALGFTEQARMGRVDRKFGRWLGTVLLRRSLR